MANTTFFNWETPDDTDLVKDGAAAIRTLGSSIDTSMSELKGGTTGQVLSKTSNTDMDFTWIAQDDSNAIQNAIVDAKGDLIAASANDTPARLAVGTNGQVLTADSTAGTGLAWAAAPGSAYISYTPTLSGVTAGNGTLVGTYVKNGKFVSGYVKFTFGSTSAITGNVIVSLPSTPENAAIQFTVTIGDSGTATYSGMGELSGGSFYVYANAANSAYVNAAILSSTIPMTWTTNDYFFVAFTYKES